MKNRLIIKRLILFTILVLFTSTAFGQITFFSDETQERVKGDIETADIDLDGVIDSLYYDFGTRSIVFLLSSRQFEPMTVLYEMYGDIMSLYAQNGKFAVQEQYMRGGNYTNYIYEKETGRFRLAELRHESYGPASNDGSGTMMLDLLTSTFVANWNYWDDERGELIPIPTITKEVINPPIYLDDTISAEMPDYDLFETYKAECIEASHQKQLRDLQNVAFTEKNLNVCYCIDAARQEDIYGIIRIKHVLDSIAVLAYFDTNLGVIPECGNGYLDKDYRHNVVKVNDDEYIFYDDEFEVTNHLPKRIISVRTSNNRYIIMEMYNVSHTTVGGGYTYLVMDLDTSGYTSEKYILVRSEECALSKSDIIKMLDKVLSQKWGE